MSDDLFLYFCGLASGLDLAVLVGLLASLRHDRRVAKALAKVRAELTEVRRIASTFCPDGKSWHVCYDNPPEQRTGWCRSCCTACMGDYMKPCYTDHESLNRKYATL